MGRRDCGIRALMLALILVMGAGMLEGAAGQAPTATARIALPAIVPVLNALERQIDQVQIVKASPREALGYLARLGNISVFVDPSVRSDVAINVFMKGVRLGDALSMVCQLAGLRLLPANGGLLVISAAAAASGSASPGALAPPVVNPWKGWNEITGLPLVPGGQTGYPRIVPPGMSQGGPGSGEGQAAAAPCARCQAPLFSFWSFCPHCGQQRLPHAPQGKYCWTCGSPHTEADRAPAARHDGAGAGR